VAIASGNFHNLALTAEGTVVASGAGTTNQQNGAEYGQAIVPSGLTNVIAIAAGDYFSLALVGNGPPVQQLEPTVLRVDESGFALSVYAERDKVYRLEYKNDLAEGQWTSLRLVRGRGADLTLRDQTTPAQQRFYRVRRW
jgi:hypothetical protein